MFHEERDEMGPLHKAARPRRAALRAALPRTEITCTKALSSSTVRALQGGGKVPAAFVTEAGTHPLSPCSPACALWLCYHPRHLRPRHRLGRASPFSGWNFLGDPSLTAQSYTGPAGGFPTVSSAPRVAFAEAVASHSTPVLWVSVAGCGRARIWARPWRVAGWSNCRCRSAPIDPEPST